MDRYYDGDQNELFTSAHIVNPNSELNPNKQIKVRFVSLLLSFYSIFFVFLIEKHSKRNGNLYYLLSRSALICEFCFFLNSSFTQYFQLFYVINSLWQAWPVVTDFVKVFIVFIKL